jgi:hypothetical protein
MTAPLVSVLAVTRRHACREWLIWNLERIEYPNLEVILVDSSGTEDTRRPTKLQTWYAEASSKLTCGQLRNVAIAKASGEYLVWVDDDDWQHPSRIRWLVEAIESTDEPWAGWCGGWLYSPKHHAVARLRGSNTRVSNGGAIYRREAVKDTAYDDGKCASDARWLTELHKRHGTKGLVLEDDRPHALWTRHERNTTPTLMGTSYPLALSTFAERVGEGAWGDSYEQISRLDAALAQET